MKNMGISSKQTKPKYMKQKCSNKDCDNGIVYLKTLYSGDTYIGCPTCHGTGFIEAPEQNAIAEISGETGVEILNILYINALRHLSNDEMKLLADNLYSKISKPEPQPAIPTEDGIYWLKSSSGELQIVRLCNRKWFTNIGEGTVNSYLCYENDIYKYADSIHPVKITPPTDGWVKL